MALALTSLLPLASQNFMVLGIAAGRLCGRKRKQQE